MSQPSTLEPLPKIPPQHPLERSNLVGKDSDQIASLHHVHRTRVFAGMNRADRYGREARDPQEASHLGQHLIGTPSQVIRLEHQRLRKGEMLPQALQLPRIKSAIDVRIASQLTRMQFL